MSHLTDRIVVDGKMGMYTISIFYNAMCFMAAVVKLTAAFFVSSRLWTKIGAAYGASIQLTNVGFGKIIVLYVARKARQKLRMKDHGKKFLA